MANYTELWTGLGVDLDRHEELCLALPCLFEEVYLEQENRPDGMSYWNMLIGEIHGLRIQELADHRARGGKVVGTFCLFVPDEVLLAAGAISVGLCGGSQFWVPDGERVLPRNLCPLIKALVGAKISRTCPYFQSCDLLVGETTCDGKKKAWEILGEYAPMYVMELPQKKNGSARARWAAEIAALAERVEELTGNQITVTPKVLYFLLKPCYCSSSHHLIALVKNYCLSRSYCPLRFRELNIDFAFTDRSSYCFCYRSTGPYFHLNPHRTGKWIT